MQEEDIIVKCRLIITFAENLSELIKELCQENEESIHAINLVEGASKWACESLKSNLEVERGSI